MSSKSSTTPLWQKADSRIDSRIMAFMAGNDLLLDNELLTYDIQASKAHVEGLQRIDVLSTDECQQLCQSLDNCLADFKAGVFVLDSRFEDGHSAIEWYLTEQLGDIGKKVHTGRSRNDQVLVASRLWLKDQLAALQHVCIELAEVLLQRAARDDYPMPGYTHIQRAVVSSTGLWAAAFAEAMLDNSQLVDDARRLIDSNPLGTAAGYGVNLPLDRHHTTQALGFERLQINPMYTQNSRGKLELHALNALHMVMLDIRRLAWDFSLFSGQEFTFITLPEAYTTGSSIMPNKRNPDYIELLRAAPAVVSGAIQELTNLLSLPSGYQRDLQNSKAPVLRAFKHALSGLALLPDLLRQFSWNTSSLNAAIEPAMLATDWAIDQSVAGVPFREAYANTAEKLKDPGQIDLPAAIQASLAERVSPGSSGQLLLTELQQRLSDLKKR